MLLKRVVAQCSLHNPQFEPPFPVIKHRRHGRIVMLLVSISLITKHVPTGEASPHSVISVTTYNTHMITAETNLLILISTVDKFP